MSGLLLQELYSGWGFYQGRFIISSVLNFIFLDKHTKSQHFLVYRVIHLIKKFCMNKHNIFSTRFFQQITFVFLVTGLSSCGDKAKLSDSTAREAVEMYLNSNPIFETTGLEIGEVKFKLKKEEKKLQAYKELAYKGYIDLQLSKQKKKFLSKDSIYVYEIRVTDKTKPFVLTQKKDQIEVKAFEYQLDDKEKPRIEVSGKKAGNATVLLKKINTDFAVLTQDKNPHSSFVTRTFKLRYKKEEGWVVVK